MTNDPLKSSHWFDVGRRCAENQIKKNPEKVPVAEIQANLKGLCGNPRASFIAGFRLFLVENK